MTPIVAAVVVATSSALSAPAEVYTTAGLVSWADGGKYSRMMPGMNFVRASLQDAH
jgi:hypothetical protein